jgi:enterochelin esterase family protein
LTLIARVQREGAPLFDNGKVTFVWQGKKPARLAGDFTHWHYGQAVDMQPAGPGLWTVSLALPPETYMEYVYILDGERQLDPFNPRKTPNGLGKYNNYFYLPPAAPTPLARLSGGKLHGKVTSQVLDGGMFVAGGRRPVLFYQPPVTHPVPLLVIWDGYDFFRRGRLAVIVDNLIARKRISPIALAMPYNGGTARMVEYACSDASVSFLQSAVLPAARSRMNLVDEEGAFGILGASMGGLMALYTAYRLPKVFGKAISFSGAFVVNQREQVIFELIKHGPIQPIAAWLDVGQFDYVHLVDSNRRIHKLMQERGYPVVYREYPAGHSYPAWRDELWRGLEHFFAFGAENK